MSENLETILNSEPEAIEEAQAEPIVDAPSDKVDPPSERLRDDRGRFAKKDETGVETPEPQKAETPEPVPPTEQSPGLPKEEYTALKAERQKRQELERRLEQMERSLRQPAPPPQQQAVDFWDDPQSFMDQRMTQLGEELFQRFEQRQVAQRIDQSEAAAKAKYADYDEALMAFEQAVHANPRLAAEMAQSPDPGEFAYSRGKTAVTLNQVGSLDALKAQLRAEWEAEVKAAVPTLKPNLPSTTAADGSVGGRSGPEWSGPKPLAQILG